MKTMYRVSKWARDIDEIYGDDESAQEKEGNYYKYFDSWEEAHKYIISKRKNRVESLESELAEAKKDLEAGISMVNPEDGDKV